MNGTFQEKADHLLQYAVPAVSILLILMGVILIVHGILLLIKHNKKEGFKNLGIGLCTVAAATILYLVIILGDNINNRFEKTASPLLFFIIGGVMIISGVVSFAKSIRIED